MVGTNGAGLVSPCPCFVHFVRSLKSDWSACQARAAFLFQCERRVECPVEFGFLDKLTQTKTSRSRYIFCMPNSRLPTSRGFR